MNKDRVGLGAETVDDSVGYRRNLIVDSLSISQKLEISYRTPADLLPGLSRQVDWVRRIGVHHCGENPEQKRRSKSRKRRTPRTKHF